MEPENLINTPTSRALAVLSGAEIQEDDSKNREHRVLHFRTVTLPARFCALSLKVGRVSKHRHKQQSEEASISLLASICGREMNDSGFVDLIKSI